MNLDSPSGASGGVDDETLSDDSAANAEDVNPSAEPSAAEGEESTATPAETDEKGPSSSLEAAKAALARSKTAADPSPAKSESEEDDDEAASEDALPDEISEDELNSYKPKTRRRIEQLTGQIRELKDEVGTLQDGHDRFVKMRQFVEGANLSSDEVNTGFNIMAAMKNDPAKAYEMLKPYVESLETVIGERLPEDLQKKVDDGYLDEETARELARSQSGEALAREAAKRAKDEAEAIQRGKERETAVSEAHRVAVEWERKLAASDPDYQVKQPLIQREIELRLHNLAAEGHPPPQTAAEITTLLDGALKTVTEQMKRFQPRKKPVDPAHRGGTTTSATRQPKDIMEAAKIGLERAAQVQA